MASKTDVDRTEPEAADIHELHDPILREKARPRDGFQPIPLTLTFIFFALLMWGGWYIGEFDGSFRPDVLEPRGEIAAAAGPEEPEEVDPMVLGEQMYTQCSACHQQNGKGVEGAFPPLDGSERVLGDEANLARILLHGLEGEVVVQGETYDGVMPAWGPQMNDAEIAAVLTYVRKSWSNDASAVEPSLVAEIREATSSRTKPWTDSQLDALAEQQE